MKGNHPQKINVALYAYGHGVETMPLTHSRNGAEKTVSIEYRGLKYVFTPAKARTVALSKTSHPKTTAPTAILSLPPGSGKNSLARPLAKWLGCTSIHDEWNPSMPVTEGWLHLTNCTAAECIDAGAKQPPTIPATSSTADLLGEQAAPEPAQPPATEPAQPDTWVSVMDDDWGYGYPVLQSIYVQNECTNTITSIRQAVYTPDQVSTHLHIGWHGTQTHTDSAGREWTRTFGPCVIDNFGSLADCYTGEPA